MINLRRLTAIALLAGLGSLAQADTVKMGGVTAAADDGRPTRGMTQARVESKYGSPKSTKAPVGDPPISRWEYAEFVVFFEYDRVIHAVRKR